MENNESNDDQTRSFTALTKGTSVSHYTIINKIGSGGMGDVYLAEDTKLKRRVALKFLPMQYINDDDLRERFTREARAVAALSHPNIVTIHEVGDFNNRPFFAMEHVPGESLRDLIKKVKLSTFDLIDLTTQICEGLQKAHEAGVVHRDIKPGNIIIDNDGRAKILDFGLAMVGGKDKLTKTGSTLGTVAYMSPEQARGEEVDARSDIFSLGCVFYELLTGSSPFDSDYEAAILYSLTNEDPSPLAKYRSGVPDGIQQIVDRALDKNVETRYQTASGMLADLKQLAVSGEVKTLPAKKPVSRFWWAAAVLVVIVIAALGNSHFKQWFASDEVQAKSLAVVDFENIGSEEDDYLASGLAEDLAVKLRNVSGFQVASSADIRRLSKKEMRAKDVASQLGVEYALGGSLLRHEERIQINVELIDEKTGKVIWSEQFNRQFTEVFQFIDEVSRGISEALEVHLIPAEKLALEQKPTENPVAYNHYLKGRHYYHGVTFRDNEFAAREFEKALKIDPDYPLALAGLADVYVQRYKERFDYDEYWLDSADLLVSQALELDNDLAEAYEARAEVLFRKENYVGALEAAEKAMNLRPELDEPYVRLGEIYYKRGERSKALEMYNKAMSIRPSVDALCNMANVYWIHGKLDSAEIVYRDAIKLNPDHERPYRGLGYFYLQKNQSEESEKMYRRAIEVRPDYAYNYSRLASLLSWRQERHDEAETLLRGFVRDYPYNFDGYKELSGWLGWGKGDKPAAMEVAEQALTSNPERAWPYLSLAQFRVRGLMGTVDREQVFRELGQALELRPGSSRVLQVTGGVYASLDSLDRAMDYYRQALDVNPGSVSILIAMAELMSQQGDYESAVLAAREVINQAPGLTLIMFPGGFDGSFPYNLLGESMVHLQRTDEYLAIVENAAENYGMDNPDLFRVLGQEQCRAGLFREAIVTFKHYLDIRENIFLLEYIGFAHWMLGENETALAYFLEGFQAEGADQVRGLEVWYISFLKHQGRHDELERYFESVHADSTRQWVWSNKTPLYYRSMRRYDDALAIYEEITETGNPRWKDSNLYAMAEVKGLSWDFAGAREIFEDFRNSGRAYFALEASFSLASLTAIEGNVTQARIDAEKALEEYSSNLHDDGHFKMLAQLQFADGQRDAALTTLGRIKRTDIGLALPAMYLKAQLEKLYGTGDTERYMEKIELFASRTARYPSVWIDVGETWRNWALAAGRAGYFSTARDAIEFTQLAESEQPDVAYYSACVYSLMGDTTLALQWLETAVERGYQELWWARVDPDLDSLRELPRFKEIIDTWDKRIQTLLR
jgi:non-specific serine/threonine protein kinase